MLGTPRAARKSGGGGGGPGRRQIALVVMGIILVCWVGFLVVYAVPAVLSTSAPAPALVSSSAQVSQQHPTAAAQLDDTNPDFGSLVTDTPAPAASAQSKFAAGVNFRVHAFYYAWYGSPQIDGEWLHWNHEILQHWTPSVAAKYPKGRFQPPEQIGADFYPALGPYSSRDPVLIDAHVQGIVQAGIGVLVLSWWGREGADGQGRPTEPVVPLILAACAKHGIRTAFHVEPYAGRTGTSVAEDVRYLIRTYGSHPGFYRTRKDGRDAHDDSGRPLVYVYDSYLTPASEWAAAFRSLRGTEHDALLIGLLVESGHVQSLYQGGFDGAYTYFASDGFTFGSTLRNWPEIEQRLREKGLLFIPSVGPGYSDRRIRPWNRQNERSREQGAYFEREITAAKGLYPRPQFVSITSWNEHHEGSAIEPVESGRKGYLDYEGVDYVAMTKEKLCDPWSE